MIERYHFPKCYLNIGQHKTINSSVHLQVETKVADEYAPDTKDEGFVDGVRAQGELSFEAYPIYDLKHPVKPKALGTLTVMDGNESSKFNIMVVQKNCDHTIIKDRLKRYFWLFYVIGRPVYDRIEIFPQWFQAQSMYRVFTCTDFRGIWPIGVSSVVVARSQVDAKRMLIANLKASGIDQPEVEDLTLTEVDLTTPQVYVLNDGKY